MIATCLLCLLALPVLLAACGGGAAPATYTCEDGKQVQATYHADGATVVVDGRTFQMYRIRSGSGARYGTEQGLTPHTGLVWWVQGQGAMLRTMVLDDTSRGNPLLTTCTQDVGR